MIARALNRLLRALLLPTVLIVALVWGLFAAMDHFAEREEARQAGVQDAQTEDARSSMENAVTGTLETIRARAIKPSYFGQDFRRDVKELIRIPPREPLSRMALQPATSEDGILLYRPVTLGAGLLSFSGRNLRLAGLEPTAADRFCRKESGEGYWPCGMMARTALRNFLRGRAVECDVASDDWTGTAVSTCTVNDQDIAAWLVERGWAEAAEHSDYAALEDEARQASRGLFGADPR